MLLRHDGEKFTSPNRGFLVIEESLSQSKTKFGFHPRRMAIMDPGRHRDC